MGLPCKPWLVLGVLLFTALWLIAWQVGKFLACEAVNSLSDGRGDFSSKTGAKRKKTCLRPGEMEQGFMTRDWRGPEGRWTIMRFTISAFNNYGFVKSFLGRVEALHPEIGCFIWVVADNRRVWSRHGDPLLPEQILDDLPDRWYSVMAEKLQPYLNFSVTELAFRYNLQCFSTAIKPAAFKFIFDRFAAQKVLYFDNDIWILQPLTTIIDALDRYNMVVTPHATEPFPVDGRTQDERAIMLAGQFNFGFIALAKSAVSSEWLTLWIERLRYYGFASPSEGMHFDQNWGNFIPSYFAQDQYLILRDPRYNIAYWNLHYRGKHLHMVDDIVMYDSEPVVFMHFSGMSDLLNYDIEGISQHQNRYKMNNFPKLRPIFQKYLALLKSENTMHWRHVPYGFTNFKDGSRVPDAARRVYARMMDPGHSHRSDARLFQDTVAFEDPFRIVAPAPKISVLSWMLEGAHHLIVEPRGPEWIPEIAWEAYQTRPDVMGVYPDPFGRVHHAEGVQNWFGGNGMREHGADSIRNHFERVWREHKTMPNPNMRLPFGVNVYGWLHDFCGACEFGRLSIDVLQASGMRTTAILLPSGVKHNQNTSLVKATRIPTFYFNLFVANAVHTADIVNRYPTAEWKRHYNIAYWSWELDQFPSKWLGYMEVFSEIWTVSDFVTMSILSSPGYAGYVETPVMTMPMGLTLNVTMYKANRTRFNFRKGTMVFLVMFDFLSSYHRKNPLSALAAFRRAFQKSKSNVLLVIKCVLPLEHFSFQQEFNQLKMEVRKSRRVRIMTEVLSQQELGTLMASVDVFVSLHRSEGYGLLLLQMLMLGKPVIATAYSGNMDFMAKLPESFQFLQIPYRYTWVNVSEPFLETYQTGQRWAEPDVSKAAKAMQMLYADRSLLDSCQKVIGPWFRKKFGADGIGSRMYMHLKSIYRSKRRRGAEEAPP
ncbi:unnamed protein product [Durusdinium trenchii]|uniref:Glycosyl transferase family 1 domain-containing protein n=1 Tax=Durusdinium trenchii TaxID=1381693 RepID=A0ABP0JBZ7_9DINO